MDASEYQAAVLRTERGINDKIPDSPRYAHLLNGLLGLAGETGEAIDLVKKHLFQGHDLDIEHFIKELGDIAWYLAATADAVGVDLDTVLQRNVDKLNVRYPHGFESARSISRSSDDV